MVQHFGRGQYFISAGARIGHTPSAFPDLAGRSPPVTPDAPLNTVYMGFVRTVPEEEGAAAARDSASDAAARATGETWDSQQQGISDLMHPTPAPTAQQGGSRATVPGEQKRLLQSLVANGTFHPFTKQVIERIPDDRVLRFKMYYRPPYAEWHKGRVALIGDAAHCVLPSVGQGLNMAIEDAFCLGTSLAEALRPLGPSSKAEGASAQAAITSAFSAFQKRRFDHSAQLVKTSRHLLNTECGLTNPTLVSLRDTVISKAMPLVFKQVKAQIQRDNVVTPAAVAQLQ